MRAIDRRGWVVAVLLGAVGLTAAAPVQDADPLAAGTKWKGKLTQTGAIRGKDTPLEFAATLTVTKRDGGKFEAELFEQLGDGRVIKLTYLVRGEVTAAKDGKGFAVEFQSYGYKDDPQGETFLKVPYTGTATDKGLKGGWKHPPNDDGTTIRGEFDLELAK